MTRLTFLFFLASMALICTAPSSAHLSSPYDRQEQDGTPRWFVERVEAAISSVDRLELSIDPGPEDQTPPRISYPNVSPEIIKWVKHRVEISAMVWDDIGMDTVYAELGGRFIPMINLKNNGKYVGYCSSNLPPGEYPITVVAVDRAGNAVKDESLCLTVLDPRDMNRNGVEDSLEGPGKENEDLRVIVLHDEDVSLEESLGMGRLRGEFGVLSAASMVVQGDRLEELARLKGIRGVYKDQKLQILGEPSEGYRIGDDPRLRPGSGTGEGVTVAILDTGADPDHTSLDDMDDDPSTNDPKIVAFKDFVNGEEEAYDDHGHGTHCASLVAGTGEGGGVAPGASLVVVKVMDRYGACYLSDALDALDWCLENREDLGIDVISFSVGGEGPSDGTSLLDKACDRMVEEGVVVCVAAGNSGPAPMSIVTPGTAEKVITAGAVGHDGEIFQKSSRGPTSDERIKPDLVAVGVEVVSAKAGSLTDQGTLSGTSMATPQVAGAAAVILEKEPQLEPLEVKKILLKSADDLGEPDPDSVYGWGALNLTRALIILRETEEMTGPDVAELDLSTHAAQAGSPVTIYADVSGDVVEVEGHIVGVNREIRVPMYDFDRNGLYTGRWETRFWDPGDYTVRVEVRDVFGDSGADAVPFCLL